MKQVLLITVMHSGTRFFLSVLEHGLKTKYLELSEHPEGFNSLAFCHTWPENRDVIERYIESHNPVIVTCTREYGETAASWKKRNRRRSDLKAQLEEQEYFIAHYDPVVLSVDKPDREDRLSLLSEKIGVELETDWRVIGSYAGIRTGKLMPTHDYESPLFAAVCK